MMKEYLINLLAQGNIQEIFNEITKISPTQTQYFNDQFVLLQSRYRRNENENNNGLVNFTDSKIERNRIESAVKSLIDNELAFSKIPVTENITVLEPMLYTQNTSKSVKVFISYSKKDNELREELATHLASLRRRNKATIWDDRHIIGGELWDETIKSKLQESNIILFLVSANFIATDYIWDYEIPIAEEQRRKGESRVIPIILKPCQWTKLDFAKQQALPSKGLPISTFLDRDTAWLEVIEGIEKVINDIMI
jgi:TIR domain/Effector-associated domain 11